MNRYFDDVDDRLARNSPKYKTTRSLGSTNRIIVKGKCHGCGTRLRYRDGLTMCIDCLYEEAKERAGG